jgi:hypothetical protein
MTDPDNRLIGPEGSPRPDLRPVDPRATASGNPDCTIVGSIDSNNDFNLANGESTSHTY